MILLKRLFHVEVPFERVLFNILSLSKDIQLKSCAISEIDSNWILNKYGNYLDPFFLKKIEKSFQPSVTGIIGLDGSVALPVAALQIIEIVAEECKNSSLSLLENDIVFKLKEARGRKGMTEDAYAELFIHLLRLYRVVADLHFIRNPIKASSFPDSFVDFASLRFAQSLSSTELVHPSNVDRVAIVDSGEFSHSSKSESLNALNESLHSSHIPSADFIPKKGSNKQGKTKNLSASLSLPSTHSVESKSIASDGAKQPSHSLKTSEKAHFPEKNATSKEIIKLLENNGFAIRGISGGHYQMQHVIKKHIKTTVPYHSDHSLSPKTLKSIRQAFDESQAPKID